MDILINVLMFFGTITVLMILHELGHAMAARALGLDIKSYGLNLTPVPHLFVATSWTNDMKKQRIYLYAGTAVTLLITAFAAFFGFWGSKVLYFGFCAQIIIETNPYHSDTVIYNYILRRMKGVKELYTFSRDWYMHVFLWMLLIIGLLSKRLGYGFFLENA